MKQELSLGYQEQVIFRLRSLYNRRGYIQYRMSKFEEYDLYARNKDFLISEGVITFMDTAGKLMALKPDVTLSIVKNTADRPEVLQKLYYNEHVYRVAKGSGNFRELMQMGLEALGNVDDYCIAEVLELACESLRSISPDSILEISHLGLLQALLEAVGMTAGQKKAALECIGQKNIHELAALCRTWVIGEDKIDLLKQVIQTCGEPKKTLPRLKELLSDTMDTGLIDRLSAITELLPDMIRFDFSVVDDLHYYNGIVFKGFIRDIPSSVLSGGQYDRLMQKMRKKSRAIGFAVYLDALERLDREVPGWDVDNLVLYDDTVPLKAIQKQVQMLKESGQTFLTARKIPEGIRYRRIMNLTGNEVETL